MKEISGDLWSFYGLGRGCAIAVTTNGDVRTDGACVMGKGTARQAKIRFEQLPFQLGAQIQKHGNHVHYLAEFGIFSFPVKHHWKDRANMVLIARSAAEIVRLASTLGIEKVYMPRPGCGNGQLSWPEVFPVVSPILDKRFTIVERPEVLAAESDKK